MATTHQGGLYRVRGKIVDAFGKEIPADKLPKELRKVKSAGKEGESASLPRAGLEGIDFASDEAAEAASEAKLVTADFEGAEKSGQGGFTKADVQKIAASKQEKQ